MINDKEILGNTDMRKIVIELLETGIDAVLPEKVMENVSLEGDELVVSGDRFRIAGRIFIIGGGKASGRMAEKIETILGPDRIESGVVNCKDGIYDCKKIEVIHAGHPTPDEDGVKGVKMMLELKRKYSIGKDDIILSLISGGGSSLMPGPVESITLEDKQEMTSLLLGCGAEIGEINTVRKHLSSVKGGQLGAFFAPATVISLILSDVIGNRLDVIASGPTVPDSAGFGDALEVLKRYELLEKAPKRAVDYINQGVAGNVPETPKELDNCRNYIIGDNTHALEAMRDKAAALGWKPIILTSEQIGDPGVRASENATAIKEGGDHDCILIGGETTPHLPSDPGKGGRNQHYIAATIAAMEGAKFSWVAASLGTDGSDFLSDVAGAIADEASFPEIEKSGMDLDDHLRRYDSFTVLEKIGALIKTGSTGTNVCDIMVYLIRR